MPIKEKRLKNFAGLQVIGRDKNGKPITANKPRTVYQHVDTEEVKAQKKAIKDDSNKRASLDKAARELFWKDNIASTDEIVKTLKERGLIPDTLLETVEEDKKVVTSECRNRINEMKIGQRADRKYLKGLERIALDESANGRSLDEVIEIIKTQKGLHKNLLDSEGKLSESGRLFIQRRMIEKELLGKIREVCGSAETLKEAIGELMGDGTGNCLIPDEYINANPYGKKETSETFQNFITRQIALCHGTTKNTINTTKSVRDIGER